jgi:hypothetical protein
LNSSIVALDMGFQEWVKFHIMFVWTEICLCGPFVDTECVGTNNGGVRTNKIVSMWNHCPLFTLAV